MKKLTALMLSLALCLSLAACGAKEEAPSAPAESTPAVSAPAESAPEAPVAPVAPDAAPEAPAEPAPEVPEDAQPEQIQPEVKPEENAPAEVPEEKPEAPVEPTVKPEENVPAETPSEGVNLETFYNDLYAELYPVDSEGFGTGPAVADFATMPEMLEGFYPGLAALCKQVHVYMPMISAVPYEVVLVEANSEADVEAIKAILQTRVDTERANLSGYPMIVENWEMNAKITVNGNFVMLSVTDHNDSYLEAFNAL